MYETIWLDCEIKDFGVFCCRLVWNHSMKTRERRLVRQDVTKWQSWTHMERTSRRHSSPHPWALPHCKLGKIWSWLSPLCFWDSRDDNQIPWSPAYLLGSCEPGRHHNLCKSFWWKKTMLYKGIGYIREQQLTFPGSCVPRTYDQVIVTEAIH